jgi:tetratricopeptide (TPR) repeat protein
MNIGNSYQIITQKEHDIQGISDLEPFIIGLFKLNEPELAEKCLDAFSKSAMTFGQYDNLSKCYFKIKKYEKSIKYGEMALVNPPSPQHAYSARFNLINVYNHANYPEKALLYLDINDAIFNTADLDLERAYTYFLLNRKKEAQKILEKTLETKKDLSEEIVTKIKFNLGTYYLYEDKFQKGMRHFILDGAKMKLWNTETIFARNEKLKLSFWQGTPGCTNLIVYAEAGIGDEIINVRFMKLLKERGINAVWYESIADENVKKNDRPGIVELFRKNNIPVITNIEEGLKIPDAMWTYSMHLPIYTNLEYQDLWYGPYLQACPTFKEKWKLEGSKKKIGIRWKGSKFYDQDLHRSYPVKQLYKNIKNFDVDYYNLQRDEGIEEIVDFPGITDLSSGFNTIEDTFALISNLDYVITSCTSIAHMAASMGKRVFVFVPISAYYTWSHSAKQSPWYGDHVTLLRQEKPRKWDEPMAELVGLLKQEGLQTK